MPATLHPRLEDCRHQHERIRERVRALVDDLTLEQFNWRPAPGRWTVAQNIAHMTAVGRDGLDVIDDLIRRGRRDGVTGSGPFRRSWLGQWFLRAVEPPYRIKAGTSSADHIPPPDLSFDDVLPDFTSMKDRAIERIEAADGLDLGRLKAKGDFCPRWVPSLTLEQWLLYLVAHERRHLWQVKTIMDDPGFPGAGPPRAEA